MTSVPLSQNALLTFLARWLRSPRHIGAIAPSSRYLARAIARQIPRAALASGAPVVELGGGTGSITQGLLEAGLSPERLFVIERDQRLTELLCHRFPGVTVLCGDAEAMPTLLAPFGVSNAAAVVSGLPLLLFSDAARAHLIESAFSLLGTGGPFIQFTYGAKSPVPSHLHSLAARRNALVLRNVPPAFVWTYRRAPRA
jgi:phosphatidylethanolamine/phosphatidyl-N-methylethanolamine N-methyltransferase